MQICMLNYDEISPDGKTLYLDCYGIGTFDVLSGLEAYLRHPEGAERDNIVIPPGTYWVTGQPVDTLYHRVRAQATTTSPRHRHHHADSFTLLSDSTPDAPLRVNGVSRGDFRLHPLNSDGTGESRSCITLRNDSDFQHLQRLLLKKGTFPVPGGKGLMAYARIDVCGTPDFSRYGQAQKEKAKEEAEEKARKSRQALALKKTKGE